MNGGIRVVLVDRDVRRRAAIAHLLLNRQIHVEPLERATELIAGWPGSGILLIEDECDSVDTVLDHMDRSGDWLPLIAFSEAPAPKRIVETILGGAVDYLALPFDAEELLPALDKAAVRGKGMISVKVRESMARSRIERLSSRERQVLSAVTQGLSNHLIAEQLGISPRTVEVHRANMLNKIGAKHTSDAIRVAIEASLVS